MTSEGDRHLLNHQLVEAVRAMAEEPEPRDTLERAVQMVTEVVEQCDLAGISVVHPDRIDTPAASSEELRRIDELQYKLEEGPCLQALREGDVVSSADLAVDPRWPRWGPVIAEEVGIHSSMSLRLLSSSRILGALSMYSYRVDAFTRDDQLDALIVASPAAVALAGSLKEEQLLRALETRRTIGEAQGILRERFGLSSDQAFAVLRRLSSHHNMKLNRVAQELVDTGQLPDSHHRPAPR